MHERRSFDRHDTGVRTQLKFLDTSAARGPPRRSQLDEKYLRTIHCSSGGHLQAAIIHRFSFRTFLRLSDYTIYILAVTTIGSMATRVGIPRNPHLKQGVETRSPRLNYSPRFALKGVPHLAKCTLCLRRYRNCLPRRYTTMHLRQFLHPV
jgi:hypothetical protein